MILIDTSVWLRLLANREPYAEHIKDVLTSEQALGHDLVYGELLIGDKGARRTLLQSYRELPQASIVPHEEVVYLTEHRKLHGQGISWIDVHLLASALVEKALLWTADANLLQLATALGVAYSAASV